jgi:hypothetical protein
LSYLFYLKGVRRQAKELKRLFSVRMPGCSCRQYAFHGMAYRYSTVVYTVLYV